MANTLAIERPAPRISQLLPTVKCSSCAREVALDTLGEHVCSPSASNPPPLPSRIPSFALTHSSHAPSASTVSHAPSASTISTTSSSSFMPFITHPAAINASRISTTPYESSLSFSPRVLTRNPEPPEPEPGPSRMQKPPTVNAPPRGSSILSPSGSFTSSRLRSQSNIHPSSRPSPQELARGETLSPHPRPSLDSARPPPMRSQTEMVPPVRPFVDAGGMRTAYSPRERSPSVRSGRSGRSPGPQSRQPSNTGDNASVRSMGPPSSSPIPVPIPPKSPGPGGSGPRDRKISNAGSSVRSMAPPSPVPIPPSRSPGPVSPILSSSPGNTLPLKVRRPSNAGASSVRSMTINMPPPPPRSPAPSANSGRLPFPNRSPTPNSSNAPPTPTQGQFLSPSLTVHPPPPSRAMTLPLPAAQSSSITSESGVSKPAAQEGVNMAGVGRRAFWESAAVPPSPMATPRPGDHQNGFSFLAGPAPQSQLQAPASASSAGFSLEGPTPPLSPALTSSSGTSSGSQLRSPIGGTNYDPRQRGDSVSVTSSAEDAKAKRLQRSATVSSTTSGSSGGSSEHQRQRGDFYKTMRDNIARDAGRPPIPIRQDTKDSETGSEIMLAYGRDSISESSVSGASSPPAGSGPSLTGTGVEEKIVFPSFPPSPPTLPKVPPKVFSGNRPSVVSIARSASTASAYSVASNAVGGPRGVSRSTPHGVDRKLLDTLTEDGSSADGAFGLSALAKMDQVPPLPSSPPSTSVSIPSSRSPNISGAPKRSHTTPTSVLSPHLKKKSKEKIKDCVTCGKKIDDGRWVPVAAGSNGKPESDQGVLCESCWKKMYLPRCRRCDLPIERGAISSSDGQLKGKYHKHCFTCTICEKPFPDKSFYVHSNNPYCAYHYHEMNSSLCANPSCGEPIEGPCAVSFDGKRKFHLEHFRCEWEMDASSSESRGRDGKQRPELCDASLQECYWEVDGKVFCERHAIECGAAVNSPEREKSWASVDFNDFYGNGSGKTKRETGVLYSTTPLGGAGGPMTKAQKRTTRYMDLAKF